MLVLCPFEMADLGSSKGDRDGRSHTHQLAIFGLKRESIPTSLPHLR